MQPILMNIPVMGSKELASLGITIKTAKIIPITPKESFIPIPKSAFLNTIRNKSKTTPAILLSSPKIALNPITNPMQKSIVIAILTK